MPNSTRRKSYCKLEGKGDTEEGVSRSEKDFSFSYSEKEISFWGIFASCILTSLGLAVTILYINVNMHHQLKNFTQAQHNSVGATSFHSQSYYRNVLIFVSVGCIVLFVLFIMFELRFLYRLSTAMESSVGRLYNVFRLLSTLELESVPLDLNLRTDTKSIKEKLTVLLECYSDQEELRQARDAINEIFVVLRSFEKVPRNVVFCKETVNTFIEGQPDYKETTTNIPNQDFTGFPRCEHRDAHSADKNIQRNGTQGHVALQSSLSPGHDRPSALHTVTDDCTATCKSGDAGKTNWAQMHEPHDSKQLITNIVSPKSLNISKTSNGVDISLERRKVTVVVASLSGFVLQVDGGPLHIHFISQQFLSITMNLAEKYGGAVLSVSADKVIVVWNAFSSAPDHEKKGVQYIFDVTIALDAFISEMQSPTLKGIIPVVVATSGYVLAGTVGGEGERVMTIHGSCVTLAEELQSLLVLLGVKCACTEPLVDRSHETFYFNPVDIVTDIDNIQHVLYEITEQRLPYLDKLLTAFQFFRSGEYDSAKKIYASAHEENREDRQVFRMFHLCSYLQKSGRMYLRQVPKWQIFHTELEESTGYQRRRKESYEWRNPVLSSVEDQLRSAILRKADGRPFTLDFLGANRKVALQASIKECGEMSIGSNLEKKMIASNSLITEFCDRQGMMFRMSNRILGRGANGSVSVGLSQTGALVAIKTVELPVITSNRAQTMSHVNRRRLRRKGINVQGNVEEALYSIMNEISLLSRLRHANIVGYISCAVVEKKLLLVMELASGGSLSNIMRQVGKVKVSRARRYLRDVLKGLEYLHRKNIVHRDIKPQNVLLLENGLCKLSDFSTSQSLQKISSTARPEGTPPYIAPEAARGDPEKASDIWSFGIMMAEMLSGSFPWPGVGSLPAHAFIYQVGHVESFIPEVAGNVSQVERDIITRCCRRNASERPTARALLDEPYFGRMYNNMTPSVLHREEGLSE